MMMMNKCSYQYAKFRKLVLGTQKDHLNELFHWQNRLDELSHWDNRLNELSHWNNVSMKFPIETVLLSFHNICVSWE